VRPFVTTPVARTGLGAAPAIGGLCWALVAWEARRAKGGPRPFEHAHPGDALLGPPGPQPVHVTWLGDSLAAGLGAETVDDTPAHLVARMLERRVQVSVLAEPGARAADVRHGQLLAMDDEPDLVVLCVGANDVASSSSRRQYATDLDAILTATNPTPTVVLSLPDLAVADRMAEPLRSLAGLRARWFEAARAQVAARHPHVTSVDITSRPAGLSRRAARSMLCADRFHPSGEGYRVWAERISMTCERLLSAPPVTTA
jgi:lysophospholipase L1-like esterase